MNEFNRPGGKTGFDLQETKLPTYWKTPFSKICLGMRIGHQINFVVVNKHANSLYSLIADGRYRATSLGRNTWKTLIGLQASLQRNCNKEGFNAVGSNLALAKARIGIVANQENNCNSCDSRIGFGTGGRPDDSNTCGNVASYSSDNGDKYIKAVGYILVQWEEPSRRLSRPFKETEWRVVKLLKHGVGNKSCFWLILLCFISGLIHQCGVHWTWLMQLAISWTVYCIDNNALNEHLKSNFLFFLKIRWFSATYR